MRMTDFSRRALAWAVAAGLVLLAAAPIAAQTTSASIFGQVKDSQGGVLPGATVTLTSRTQASSQSATTDREGRFAFPIVRPDLYALKISMEGFKTLERTNVQVSANDKFSAGTVTLEVGAITEEVSVTGRVTELQAQGGERSGTLESQAIQNIASNGRQVFNFALLVPGVVNTDNNAGNEVGNATGFAVNGQRETSNNVTIDGVANIDTGNNGGPMATTNTEAVGEFKILTNSYSAEYGRAVGGQVQMVTKSGTQSFHGSGYWFGRRSDWNANTWTNLRQGAPAPVGNGKVAEPPQASRDNYGYTIGGPIYIPGVFNKDKKKLFFFWSQEFQNQTNPPQQHNARVPTALERAGDFSQSVDGSGNPYPYIRDYQIAQTHPTWGCNATDQRACFADGGVLGRIPQSRLYGEGLAALNLFPLPNYTSGGGVNYTSQASDSSSPRQDLIRLDFQPTDQWRVTGRYMDTKNDVTQAYGTPWAGNGSYQVPLETLFKNPGYNWMVSTTGILNNTTSLEVSVGTAHNSLNYVMNAKQLYRANSGLTDFPYLYGDAVQKDYVPFFNFGGTNIGNQAEYQTGNGPFSNENTTWDVVANLTKIWGPHNAKFGVYYQSSFKPQTIFFQWNAQVDFAGNPNNPFDTSLSYANAATGVFNTYNQVNQWAEPQWKYKNYEWYAQDNWKVNQRLTIDFGVRFYYLTPQWDVSKGVSNWLPDKYNPANAAVLYQPAIVNGVQVGLDPATGGTVDARFIGRLTPESNADAIRFNGAYAAGQGITDSVQSGNAFKVSPRFGLVYDISGKGMTIVRGGFAVLYDRPMGNIVFDMGGNAPSVLNSQLQWGRLQDLTAAQGDPNTTLGASPTAYDFTPPRVLSWNVGVQHKLPYKLILDVAYVGSSGKNLLRNANINAPPLGATFQPQNQDPTKPPSSNGSSALSTDFLRPYSGYNNMQMYSYTGLSNYQSLQTSLQRRFDNGLMFSVFYVWSKSLATNSQDYSGGNLPYWPTSDEAKIKQYDWSYGGYDRPQNFVVNFIYQVPQKAKGALGLLVNGWQISGVYRWSSGVPYRIQYSIPGVGDANLTGTSAPQARVVLTCDPGSGSSSDPYKQLNTSCFAPPQQGSNGLESGRLFVHGPATNNLDLSLSKSFTIHKDVRFEVRLDAFNALNHTQFTGVNNTINFASLTDKTITNLPYDANGNLVNINGFGTINGVAAPRTLQLVTRLTF
jgi:carboxypeptidase family protein/TonB-dependent receptor-like protein